MNDSVNENSPNWFLYRLTADRMKSLKAVSTHWRATCSFDKHGINRYKDYVRGRFADADILTYLGSGVCLKTELVNIRGHIGIHRTARFWQVLSAYLLHIDSSSKACQCFPNVGSVPSEDNFGHYHTVNPKFTCTMNEDSTNDSGGSVDINSFTRDTMSIFIVLDQSSICLLVLLQANYEVYNMWAKNRDDREHYFLVYPFMEGKSTCLLM